MKALSLTFLTLAITFALPAHAIAQTLTDHASGRLLLQVESQGELWYVDPDSRTRTLVSNPNDAFGIVKEFGIGIADSDLDQLPYGLWTDDGIDDADGDGIGRAVEEAYGLDPNNIDSDGDGYDDRTEIFHGYDPKSLGKQQINESLVERLKGKLVIRVEGRGEVFYIHPDDGKRYFLNPSAPALAFMQKQFVGISNSDIEQIAIHETSRLPNCEKNDTECFAARIASCTPSKFYYGWNGSKHAIEYEVLGWSEKDGRCNVFQQSHVWDWSNIYNLSMTCAITAEEARVAFDPTVFLQEANIPGIYVDQPEIFNNHCSGSWADYFATFPQEMLTE